MPEYRIVKTTTGKLLGASQADEEARRKHHAMVTELEPGEMFNLKYWQEPDPVLHRRLMALFRIGFNHWDPASGRKRLKYKGRVIEKSYDQFRKDITIQAGYYDASFDARGRVHLEAKSLSYGKMTDEEKQRLLDAVVNVLLARVLPATYTRDELARVLAEEIQRFGSNNP